MFLFKKIVAPLLFPLSIILEILILGIFLLWFTRRQKTGKVFVFIGALLLGLLSYSSISDICLKPLEDKYAPLVELQTFSDVKWIVVLGGGHNSDPKLPVTGPIGDSSLSRLLEGVRIHKKLPESKLILSGSGVYDPVSNALVMAGVAKIESFA